MAKRKVELSTNQKKRNASILAQIEAERSRLFEDTRALQQQFRRNIKRKRSRNRRLSEEIFEER
jgi:ABC-type siderophore export system fused ATPase/permease subunit